MARLLSITAYAEDSTVYASASPMAINCENIKSVINASTGVKKSVPAASGSINSVIKLNTEDDNSGVNHTYLVGESIATLVTASA